MKQYPLLSIIVPIYNVEIYIKKCLDIILSQSFTDIEIILVDDGSPDKCPEICDEYAKKNSNVKVVHQKNRGLSGARNAGARVAIGKYITFCDPDDKYEPEALATYADCISKYYRPNTLYCAGYHVLNENDVIVSKNIPSTTSGNPYVDINEGLQIMEDNNLGGYTWNKLYERKIITDNNLSFNENYSAHEDKLFLIQYLKFIENVCFIPHAVYKYYVRYNSLSYNYKNIKQRVEALDDSLSELRQLDLNNVSKIAELKWCGAWLKIYLKKVSNLEAYSSYTLSERIEVIKLLFVVSCRYVYMITKNALL